MKRTMVAAMVVCIGMFSAVPANAQSSRGPTWLDPVSDHHKMQYRMMKDMSEVMDRMMDQMSQGEPTPEQRKEMAERMTGMSTIMQRMSGLEARPAMREPEWQRQMDEMRNQLDEMLRNSRMAPGAK